MTEQSQATTPASGTPEKAASTRAPRQAKSVAVTGTPGAVTSPTGGSPTGQPTPAGTAIDPQLEKLIEALGALEALSALSDLSKLGDLSSLASLPGLAAQQVEATKKVAQLATDLNQEQQANGQRFDTLIGRIPVAKGLSAEQASTAARFQALRSSLGGARRLSSAPVLPAMPPPQVNASGRVTLGAPLPTGAVSVVVRYEDPADGGVKQKHLSVQGGQTALDPQLGTARLLGFEVRDARQEPLQFGVPA